MSFPSVCSQLLHHLFIFLFDNSGCSLSFFLSLSLDEPSTWSSHSPPHTCFSSLICSAWQGWCHGRECQVSEPRQSTLCSANTHSLIKPNRSWFLSETSSSTFTSSNPPTHTNTRSHDPTLAETPHAMLSLTRPFTTSNKICTTTFISYIIIELVGSSQCLCSPQFLGVTPHRHYFRLWLTFLENCLSIVRLLW